ncbi:hypothetical protein ACEZ3G_03145 [Maribacter algicola]|uniref:Uncharacterized protein n=1 Tax=Meishania litoralis TaxID=3434685 RepID=A0ACC7LFL3_9FLAO
MNFFRIILLSAICHTFISCRETLGEQHQDSRKEQSVPSYDSVQLRKTPDVDKSRDSDDTKPKKPLRSKKRDTLKPLQAKLQ